MRKRAVTSSVSSRKRADSVSNGGLGARRVGSGLVMKETSQPRAWDSASASAGLVVAGPVADVEKQLGGQFQL